MDGRVGRARLTPVAVSSQNRAQRHHYIPVFYLKRWVDRNGRLVEFSKPWGEKVKPRRVAPAGTGFVDRLYELRGLSPDSAAFLEERYFSPIDSRAAEVLFKMETGTLDFSEAERTAWAQFLLTLVTRLPTHVQEVKDYFKSRANHVTPQDERRWKRIRKSNEPATFEQALRSPGVAEYIDRQSLHSMANFSQNEKLGAHLINMRWGVREMPFSVAALLTCDRPLQWFGAMSAPDCHFLLPIGPKRVFWACNEVRMADHIMGLPADKFVAFLNNMVVRRALKHVYALGEDRLLFVQGRMGVDPEPQPPDRFSRRV